MKTDPTQVRFYSPIGLHMELLFLVALSTVVGLLFTFIGDWGHWWQNLAISYLIGFSIWSVGRLLRALMRPSPPLWALWAIPPPVGVLVGVLAANLFGLIDAVSHQQGGLRILAANLTAATAAAAVFILFYQWSSLTLEITESRRRSSELREAETLSRLALLQAQIEPHFLFNTLANVRSLISRDPNLAQEMLDHLNDYLRISLSRTRKLQTSLAEELDLVGALLAISRIRLGERLTFRMDIPAALHSLHVPPLIVQPLVENAIRHGIEPSLEGGEITLKAIEANGFLQLTVRDTGVGLGQTLEKGIGLTNVEDRLASLYGSMAKLSLEPNHPHGVVAVLTIPIERPAKCQPQ